MARFPAIWLLFFAACGGTSVLGTGNGDPAGGAGASCDGSSDGAVCDDGDACTTADACVSGVCAGTLLACDAPPAPVCINTKTLRTFAEAGTCSAAGCEYAPTDTTCPDACMAGACVPVGRRAPTSVWTGSEMIVWGGIESGDGLGCCANTGGRYNPATDTWAALSASRAPAKRYDHSAVWTGSEMIIWGGYDDDEQIHMNHGGRYNPTTDTWVPLRADRKP